jgi:hypothetical protein
MYHLSGDALAFKSTMVVTQGLLIGDMNTNHMSGDARHSKSTRVVTQGVVLGDARYK